MRFDYPDEKFQELGKEKLRKLRRSFLLSLLVPGLGQILSGRLITGIFFMLIFTFPFYYLYLIGPSFDYGTISFIVVQIFIYIFQAIDAGRQPFRETSPCEDFCPASVNVPSFMSLVASGKKRDAVGLFYVSNPFPFTLGEVCPAQCEEKCGILPDRGLRIREVHREFGREFLESLEVKRRKPVFEKVDKKVAVIGSGPAGITVSYFLASCGIEVDLFEKEEKVGGLLNAVPEFKVNRKLLEKEIGFALSYENINLHLNTYIDSIEELKSYDAVVLSTGCSKDRELDIEVKSSKLVKPLDFLKLTPEVNGKRVLIIGGGDTAFDVARLCVRKGGSALLFYRGSFENMKAQRREIDSALKEGVKVYTRYVPKKILERKAIFDREGKEVEVEFDFIVPAVGFERDESFLKNMGVNPGKRFQGKIFLCGDLFIGASTVVEACGDAKLTAYEVLKSLKLKDRAWFMLDFYIPKKENIKATGEIEVEAALCQHCGMKVRS